MERSVLTVASSWGVTLQHESVINDPPGGIGVVLFPGDHYRCDAPLLYYARMVSLQRGADVLCLEYGHQVARVALRGGQDMDQIACESAQAVQRFVRDSHRRLVFISKSLGTWVAGAVARRCRLSVTHIFLTPVSGAIQAMIQDGGTVIVGKDDPVFDEIHLGQIVGVDGLDVRVIPGANHGLLIPADYQGSLDALRTVADCCHEVLAGVGSVVANERNAQR